MLVSATLNDEVLQQFRPHCPNLVPVFLGRDNSRAAAEPAATEHNHSSVTDSGSPAAGQPRWGWDEATGGHRPATVVHICEAILLSMHSCGASACGTGNAHTRVFQRDLPGGSGGLALMACAVAVPSSTDGKGIMCKLAGSRQDGDGGGGTLSAAVSLPPHLDHTHVVTDARHRVDTVRRCIHALDAQRVLVFMNYQQRLKVQTRAAAVRVCIHFVPMHLRAVTWQVPECTVTLRHIPRRCRGSACGHAEAEQEPVLTHSCPCPQDTEFKLEATGMKVASLHGEMSKMERQQVLAKFRAGGYRAMVGSTLTTAVKPLFAAHRMSLCRLVCISACSNPGTAVAAAAHMALSE